MKRKKDTSLLGRLVLWNDWGKQRLPSHANDDTDIGIIIAVEYDTAVICWYDRVEGALCTESFTKPGLLGACWHLDTD